MIYKSVNVYGLEVTQEISPREADSIITSYILKDWTVEAIDGVGISLTTLFYHPKVDGPCRPLISIVGDVEELKCYERITDPVFIDEQKLWIHRARNLEVKWNV